MSIQLNTYQIILIVILLALMYRETYKTGKEIGWANARLEDNSAFKRGVEWGRRTVVCELLKTQYRFKGVGELYRVGRHLRGLDFRWRERHDKIQVGQIINSYKVKPGDIIKPNGGLNASSKTQEKQA